MMKKLNYNQKMTINILNNTIRIFYSKERNYKR